MVTTEYLSPHINTNLTQGTEYALYFSGLTTSKETKYRNVPTQCICSAICTGWPSKSQHLIYNTYVADEHLYVHRIGGVVGLYIFPQHAKVLPPPPDIIPHHFHFHSAQCQNRSFRLPIHPETITLFLMNIIPRAMKKNAVKPPKNVETIYRDRHDVMQ